MAVKLFLIALFIHNIVIADELISMQENKYNWVMPAGNYNNQRYSELSQINKDNVIDMTSTWSFSTGILRGHEGSTLVIDGTLYLHTPFPNEVLALDLNVDGAIKWTYKPKQNHDETVPVMCCDIVNRGLAYADGKLFLNQADTTLVALDINTGKKVWKHQRDDPKRGATSTGAPHVFKDKVLVGISGGEFGVRGYIKAYSLDGQEKWQFYNTGPDDEMGFDPKTTTSMMKPVGKNSSLKTWQGDQWQLGGGTTWGWFSYDPDVNLFYYGSGNPSTWNPVLRPGDNKWTSSLFARDLDSGLAKWVYQMTPHDEWGFDGVNEIPLVDQKINDKLRKTAVHFDANGFAYTFDRINGELLLADKFSPSVNWSRGVNLETGRHDRVVKYSTEKEDQTTGICPANIGAKNQGPSAYSPRTGLFYVPINRVCMDYETFKVRYIAGQPYVGASVDLYRAPGGTHLGNLIAWDPRIGKIVWYQPERYAVWSGALATASDLVFYGTLEGYIKALDAQSGRELWRFKTPSGIVGNVNTYKHLGKQYISVLSGIGGWAGVAMSIPSIEKTERWGSHGAYRSLSNWTRLGGVLSVFSLK